MTRDLMRTVLINHEPIELYKLLKLENMVATGGEAKLAVAEGLVQVNGAVELRKRKKIVDGDIVEFAGQRMLVRLGR